MRVIAGQARGRRLHVPQSGTRPTSQRVREAMFSRLDHYGGLTGARVLDLFAGSGALGIEALSRGATSAMFVDAGKAASRVCQRNLAATGFGKVGRVHTGDVVAFLSAGRPGEGFDLVFVDPPVHLKVFEKIITSLSHGWLNAGALIIWEQINDPTPVMWPDSFDDLGSRDYGDTRLNFGEYLGESPPQ